MSGLGFRRRCSTEFESRCAVYWANLGRFTNLLVILNVSFFFLTELVTEQGYYYTYYSLFFLFLTYVAMLLPLGLVGRLELYLVCLGFEAVALYFLASSVWYWVVTNRSAPPM